MKTRTTLFVTTALVATLAAAGAAFAHQGGGMGSGMGGCEGRGQGMGMMGMGPGGGMGKGMGAMQGGMQGAMQGAMQGGMQGEESVAAVTARLADQKAALKITPAQDAAWGKYATLVTQQTEAHENMRTQMHAKMQDPKEAATIDHAALRETMMKLQQENQLARTAAMDELQALLTPEQKALAGRGPQGAGGHRMGGPGMWH